MSAKCLVLGVLLFVFCMVPIFATGNEIAIRWTGDTIGIFIGKLFEYENSSADIYAGMLYKIPGLGAGGMIGIGYYPFSSLANGLGIECQYYLIKEGDLRYSIKLMPEYSLFLTKKVRAGIGLGGQFNLYQSEADKRFYKNDLMICIDAKACFSF